MALLRLEQYKNVNEIARFYNAISVVVSRVHFTFTETPETLLQ